MTARTYAPIEVTPQPYQALAYSAGLDGLRAISVLAVLAYHLDLSWADGGYLGVEAFFVISGFLITRLLLDEDRLTGGVDRRAFWRRRARRLLPAAMVVIAGVLVWAAVALPTGELRRFRADALASAFYVENWKLILAQEPYFSALGRPSPLRHLWSLAIEEQFYLLWPLVLPLFVRRLGRARTTWLITAGAAWSVSRMIDLGDVAAPERAYYGTDTRAFGILLGAALACWLPSTLRADISRRARTSINRISLLALATLAWQFSTRSEFDSWTYPWGFLTIDIATMVLVVAILHPAARVGDRLGSRVLAGIGRRSYSLYLWHWPVIAFTQEGLDWGLTGRDALLARLAIIGVLSEASYRWIEQPIRAGRLQIRVRRAIDAIRRSGWGVATVAATTLVVVALVGSLANAPAASDQLLARATVTPPPTTTTTTAPTTTVPVPTTTAAAGALPVPAPTTAPTTTAAPAPKVVTLLGESVTLGAAPDLLTLYGDKIRIDAVEGRAFNDSVAALEAIKAEGTLGDIVVAHLGNNGAVPDGALDRLLSIADTRPLILVTVHVPRRWEGQVNDSLKRFTADNPDVQLVDWFAVAKTEPGLLISDQVHLTEKGRARYTEFIRVATS